MSASQGRSFNPLLTTLLERFTGSQIECLSGLLSLEQSQEICDLTAREWMALSDHGGGGIGFSWKMKGAFGIEQDEYGLSGRSGATGRNYLLLLITCTVIMMGRVLHLHLLH